VKGRRKKEKKIGGGVKEIVDVLLRKEKRGVVVNGRAREVPAGATTVKSTKNTGGGCFEESTLI